MDTVFEIPTSGSNSVSWISEFCQVRDISIAYVDLAVGVCREGRALEWLDQKEKGRLERYRYDRPRRQFTLCRSALRQIICRYLGCKNEQLSFDTNEHGKPIALIENNSAPVSVNLSHSGNHGVVGITQKGDLGIDIEIPVHRSDLNGIGQLVFTTNEQSELIRAIGKEKLSLFYKFWTLKEALIKGLGTGFSLNPSLFELPSILRSGGKSGVFRFPHISQIPWQLDYIDGKEFALALAHGRDISHQPSS